MCNNCTYMLLFNKFSYFVLDTANYCVHLLISICSCHSFSVVYIHYYYLLLFYFFIYIFFMYVCMYVCMCIYIYIYIYMYAYIYIFFFYLNVRCCSFYYIYNFILICGTCLCLVGVVLMSQWNEISFICALCIRGLHGGPETRGPGTRPGTRTGSGL